jgi:hypothetical protein
LWRGLLQITNKRPWRFTSLQFSQIRFTLARTFIAELLLDFAGANDGNCYFNKVMRRGKG